MNIHSTLADAPVYSEFTNDADFEDLLQFFAKIVKQKITVFNELSESGNRELLRGEAHKLKGSAGGYGFPELSLLAATLEANCSKESTLDVKPACANVIDYMQRIRI